MPWWRKRSAASAPPPASLSPGPVELIPGQLAAQIYLHDLSTQQGTLACWTYLTEGLMRLHQPEVSVTLLRQPNTPPPQEPLHLFSMLHHLAQQGQLVHSGGWTQFGARKFFDRHLIYVPAQALGAVTLPRSALMAISVTDEELVAAQAFGTLRVMARLGQQARYYPCPPWLDPSRPGLAFAQTHHHSLLTKLAKMHLPHLRVVQIQDRLVVRVASTSRPGLSEALANIPETQPLAFLTGLDGDADSCLVWEPGQTEPIAISPPESRGRQIAGCFVAWIPEQADDGGQLREDGFVVWLTTSHWRAIRKALLEQQPLELTATPGRLRLRIEWDQQ